MRKLTQVKITSHFTRLNTFSHSCELPHFLPSTHTKVMKERSLFVEETDAANTEFRHYSRGVSEVPAVLYWCGHPPRQGLDSRTRRCWKAVILSLSYRNVSKWWEKKTPQAVLLAQSTSAGRLRGCVFDPNDCGCWLMSGTTSVWWIYRMEGGTLVKAEQSWSLSQAPPCVPCLPQGQC